ncbi:MAG: AmmeMemoRadiSam system radical SAM enzyme [Oscillospiraceae bacterium]
MRAVCNICPHHCDIEEGHTGLCRARENRGGEIVCKNYGMLTGMALDPIKKKPLSRFYPGSRILSVGSYGCNLRCPFCQNCEISMSGGEGIQMENISPRELVGKAMELVPVGNIGIAYTYNEPLVGFEYVLDCSRLAKEQGLKNVVVTNGYICEEPLKKLLPEIDAMNIDLKGYTERFYKMLGGDLEAVRRAIELSARHCHVEVTTLIVPGENDSEEEMGALSGWLSSLNPEIPLHVTRFFPRWKMMDRDSTPVETIYRLAEKARESLKYVYEGNC